MNKKYWEDFYKDFEITEPSDFARFCLDYIPDRSTILDLGCGNGRDSYYFAAQGHKVLGVDYAAKPENATRASFNKENIADFLDRSEDIYDVKYCRWLFHATEPEVWKGLLEWTKKGLLMIEARAIGDDSFRDNHKRRLVDESEVLVRLSRLGFTIKHFNKDRGLAVLGGQDPLIIRIIAEK